MRREGMRTKVAAILQCAVLASTLLESHSQDSGTCRYRYTQQPPRNLPCNPYTSGRLITRCEVRFGPTEETVEIQWAFNQSNTESILSHTGSKYSISPGSSTTSVITSQLRVELLSDSDVGAYYCRVRFRNGSLAKPSQELNLFSSSVFNALQSPPCSSFAAQESREELCALTGSVDNLPGSNGVDSEGGDDDTDGGSDGVGTIILYSVIAGVVVFLIFICFLVPMAIICSGWINKINRYT